MIRHLRLRVRRWRLVAQLDLAYMTGRRDQVNDLYDRICEIDRELEEA